MPRSRASGARDRGINHLLGELAKRRAHLVERRDEIGQSGVVGARELALELPLAEPQELLLGGLLVDARLGRTRVELCQQRSELLVGRAFAEEMRPQAPVELVVKVL